MDEFHRTLIWGQLSLPVAMCGFGTRISLHAVRGYCGCFHMNLFQTILYLDPDRWQTFLIAFYSAALRVDLSRPRGPNSGPAFQFGVIVLEIILTDRTRRHLELVLILFLFGIFLLLLHYFELNLL